jgi:hypothetical protein
MKRKEMMKRKEASLPRESFPRIRELDRDDLASAAGCSSSALLSTANLGRNSAKIPGTSTKTRKVAANKCNVAKFSENPGRIQQKRAEFGQKVQLTSLRARCGQTHVGLFVPDGFRLVMKRKEIMKKIIRRK